ncbi:MAG: hypothetical protein M3Y87_02425 [Myxococcota bacterium]|nr:hypothetical protein [Myxococcota bacterium]
MMYADTAVNLVLMAGSLFFAAPLAAALEHETTQPLLVLAALFGLSAAWHGLTGLSGSRGAVKVMVGMDAAVVVTCLLLAVVLDAPDELRGLLVLGAALALTMGGLKLAALRTPHDGALRSPGEASDLVRLT